MADKKQGEKPQTPKPGPEKGKALDNFNKGLDRMFGPKKGDGSNRS